MIRSLPAATGTSSLLILLALFAPVSEEDAVRTSPAINASIAKGLPDATPFATREAKPLGNSSQTAVHNVGAENQDFEFTTIPDEPSEINYHSLIDLSLSPEQQSVVEGRRKAWLDYEVTLQAWLAEEALPESFTEKVGDEQGLSESAPVPPPWICFAEGASPALIEAVGANRSVPAPAGITGEITPLAFQYFPNNRWRRSASNPSPLPAWKRADKIVLTWGIVADGTMAPGLSGHPDNSEPAPSNLRARLNAIYGSEAAWIRHFQSVFDSWAERAGIRYVYQPQDDGVPLPNSPGQLFVRPDIRISGRALDGDFGVLATNYGPNSGDMIIDTSDAYFENIANDSLPFRNTIAHEHGHGLGLSHVCPINSTKLMEPSITTAFDGPQIDDIYSAQRSYGDAYEDRDNDIQAEDNNNGNRPADLGIFPSGTRIIQHLSIDDNDDQDYYKISQPAPGSALRVKLRPIGGSYLEGGQNADDSCSAGTFFAAGSVHDLNFNILDRTGNIIARADSQPAGVTESVEAFFPPAGDLRIHVLPTTNTDRVQLYDLEITFIDPASFPVVSAAATSQRESEGTMLIQISKSHSFPEIVSVDYSLESISATAAQDYTATSGTITLQGATISQVVRVPIINDLTPEIDETFQIRLSNPIFARIPAPTATLTIRDDDAQLYLRETVGISLAPDGRPILSWGAVPGRTYRIEHSPDMINWTPLPGAAAIVAEEALESFTAPTASEPSRLFYRLVDPS